LKAGFLGVIYSIPWLKDEMQQYSIFNAQYSTLNENTLTFYDEKRILL